MIAEQPPPCRKVDGITIVAIRNLAKIQSSCKEFFFSVTYVVEVPV